MAEGSWVGLDVHARTTLAGVLDGASGELRVQPARSEETVASLSSLPLPVRVAYEAGPEGLRAGARLRAGGDRLHGGGAVEDPAPGR